MFKIISFFTLFFISLHGHTTECNASDILKKSYKDITESELKCLKELSTESYVFADKLLKFYEMQEDNVEVMLYLKRMLRFNYGPLIFRYAEGLGLKHQSYPLLHKRAYDNGMIVSAWQLYRYYKDKNEIETSKIWLRNAAYGCYILALSTLSEDSQASLEERYVSLMTLTMIMPEGKRKAEYLSRLNSMKDIPISKVKSGIGRMVCNSELEPIKKLSLRK